MHLGLSERAASGEGRYFEPLLKALDEAAEHAGDVIWDVVWNSAGDPLADEVHRRFND